MTTVSIYQLMASKSTSSLGNSSNPSSKGPKPSDKLNPKTIDPFNKKQVGMRNKYVLVIDNFDLQIWQCW